MTEALRHNGFASHPLDEEFVLRGRILREDTALNSTARFRHDRWSLTPAQQHHQPGIVLDFATPTRQAPRRAVRLFWLFRQCLTIDRLPFDPQHVDGWTGETNRTTGENSTARIPEPVHGPLLAWALRFVDEFAPDILAANEQQRQHHDPNRRPAVGHNQSIVDELRHLMDDYRQRRRPLPGHNGRPNISFIADQLGCGRNAVKRHYQEIETPVAAVGVSSDSCFDIPITGRLDDRPWIHGIASNHLLDNGAATLTRMLRAACYTTIAFLSGMRDSEIRHLRRGCLQVNRGGDGKPYRWKVTSLAFKGEKGDEGVPATWVIGASAARAITILERLQPVDQTWLFSALSFSPGSGSAAASPNEVPGNHATNTQLNAFIGWINTYCAAHDRADVVPAVNGQPWRL